MAKRGGSGPFLVIALDRGGEVPLYLQILDRLRDAIGRGQLAAGARLPSTRVLALEWGVARNTVLHVFETLAAEGFFEARVGDGTYVARDPPAVGQCLALPATDPARAAASRHDASPFARATSAPASPDATPGTAPSDLAAPDAAEADAVPIDPTARAPSLRSLSRRGRALIDQGFGGLTERPTPFMPDVPDLRAFPIRTWLRLLNEVSGRLTGEILVHVSNAGYGPLREAIAHHLRTSRGVACEATQVIITTGSQQSLDLVVRLLVERGDPVWMEEPGYIGARASLVANGCNVLPVPTDDEGMDLARSAARLPVPRLVYVSPSRQYPLGVTMSDARRAELLEFARRTGAWVLEDDYDCDFRYEGAPLAAIQAGDREGRVVHIGTFSKTLLPSFRLGFIVVPLDLAADFARARAVIDRHASVMEQMVLAEFLHRGLYVAHLRRMRALYRERQRAMVKLLADALGHEPEPRQLASGMHLVVRLRPGSDDQAVARALWRGGTVARPLSLYYAGRDKPPGLLLGFAAYTPEEMEAHRGRLAALRGALADESAPGATLLAG